MKYFKQDYLDYIEGRTAPKLSAKQLVGAHYDVSDVVEGAKASGRTRSRSPSTGSR